MADPFFAPPDQRFAADLSRLVQTGRGLPGLQEVTGGRATAQAEPDYQTVSARYDVPINVLMAVGEDGGDVERAARTVRTMLSRGLGAEDAIVSGLAGGNADAGRRLIDRAYQIADEQFPEPRSVETVPLGAADAPQTEWKPVGTGAPAAAATGNDDGNIFSDTLNLFRSGVNTAAEDVQELVRRTPIVGQAIVDAASAADRWMMGKSTDEIFREQRQAVEAGWSPEMLAARRKDWVSEGPDGYSFGPAWSDPRAYYSGLVESLPEMVVTMGPTGLLAKGAYTGAIARGAGKEAAARAAARTAMLAGGLMEGGLGGAQSSRSVRDRIGAMTPEQLASSDAMKTLMAQGKSFDEARTALADKASTQAFILAGVTTGIFGGLGDRALAKIITGPAKGRLSAAVRGAVGEGLLEEAPQSGFQQISENAAMQNADPNQRLMEGVANQAAGGAVVGGLMGAGLGAAAPRAGETPDARPAVPEDAAPAAAPEAGAVPAATPGGETAEQKGPMERALDHGIAEVDAAVRRGSILNGKRVTVTDEYGNISGTVTNEGAYGITFQSDDGQLLEYSRDDLDAGAVTLEAENAAPAADISLPAGAEAPGPADAPVDTGPADDLPSPGIQDPAAPAEPETTSITRPASMPAAPGEDAVRPDAVAATAPAGKTVPPAPAAEPQPAVTAPDTGTMSADDLRARLDYLGQQAMRSGGWDRRLTDERARVEAALATLPTPHAVKDADGTASDLGLADDRVAGDRQPEAGEADQQRESPATAEGGADGRDSPAEPLRGVREALPDAGDAGVAGPALTAAQQWDAAAHEAATSPNNDLPEPTQAQKETGNYRLGHLKIGGLDISVENPQGSQRKGVDKDGKPWAITMQSHYGYIRGTVGRDKDHVDTFVKPGTTDLPDASHVFVVNQVEPTTGRFDEHKVLIGYRDRGEAEAAYRANYARGWKGLGSIVRLTAPQFRNWLDKGDTTKPLALPAPAPSTKAENGAGIQHDSASGADALGAREAGQVAGAAADAGGAGTGRRGAGAPAPRRPADLPREREAIDIKPALKPAFRDGKVGDKLAAGERVKTATGRPTTPFPNVDTSTNIRAINTLRRVDEWLMDNAADEAKARGDEMNESTFRAYRKKPSQADKDAAEFYLFDKESVQPQPAPFLRPLSAPEDATPKPKSGRKSPRKIVREREAALSDYFTPGNIVSASTGGFDRVISFDPAPDGYGHLVTVQAVRKDGDRWVDVQGEGIRRHGTMPSARDLKSGPVGHADNTPPLKMQKPGAPEDGKPVMETKRETITDEPRKLDQGRGSALAGELAGAVPAGSAGRSASEAAARSSGTDAPRDERAGSVGPDDKRSVGDGARAVSVSPPREQAGPDDGDGRAVVRGRNDADQTDRNAQESVKPADGTTAADLPADFAISEEDEIGAGGAKTKFRNNIAAIRLLRQLQQDGRKATRKEQAVLAKFVGWGGLQAAFGRTDGTVAKGWDKEAAELRDLLTEEEYKAAAASTRNAHYTSPEIVSAMWDAVHHLGFRAGRVLEPSLGVGNFFGLMPADMRAASALHGVELDNITGGIAQNLYPGADIAAPMGFQDYTFPDGTFDLVIGNPPFGAEKLYDPKRKDLSKFSIHNYFFAKSIDGLRPNGVLAMVVTNRMMDTIGGRPREYIAERAELLGAIRLPNNAFAKNAGTEVTTDIIFLRRREAGEKMTGERWLSVGEHTDKNGKKVPINEYFARHPENMLGDFGAFGTMYRPDDPALIARPGQDTAAMLREAIAQLPKGVAASGAGKPTKELISARATVGNVRIGSMFIDNTAVMVRGDDVMGKPQAEPVSFASDKARERVIGMIGVRDALTELRRMQLSPVAKQAQIDGARRRLNDAYDAFVKESGPINADVNKRLFRDDPSWPQISALEESFEKAITPATAKNTGEKARPASARKAAIFTRRTQAPYTPPVKASSAKDALIASLSETGRIDLPMMERLYGKSADAIIAELGDLVFDDPSRGWVTHEEYLSGNVKAKLAQAEDAARSRPEMARNVDALKLVQPAPVEAVDIAVKPGAHWVPVAVMQDFSRHIAGVQQANVTYSPATAKWAVDMRAAPESEARWGTGRASVAQVLQATFNQTQITIRDHVDRDTTVVNESETQAANEKVAAVRAEWDNWLWQDDGRRNELGQLYNDLFNTTVNRSYDGSHLTFPGKVDDAIIKLRPHQANAVWRTLQSPATLYDHVVGAGKTFTAIAAAMEMRRMGLARKPMFVVPNHLVGQWAKDFLTLYPGANVLATSKEDFEANRRKRLFARITTGDWDAVIVAHSSFGKVEVEPEAQSEFIDQQVADLSGSIAAMRAQNGAKGMGIKDIEKRIALLKEKQKKLLDTGRKDNAIYWGELGIDSLFVDEAHEFKNLAYSTSMNRVAGLGNKNGSQKAADLYLKSRQVLKTTGGRNLVFMTGTPISNTMAEMFTMQRYLDGDALAAQGLSHFDAWARQFGEVVTDWELSPAGKYKLNSRFAKFVNMPELLQRYSSFSDVVTRDDIARQLAAQGKRLPIPGVKGGKPANIVVNRSDDQAVFIGQPVKDADGNETDQYPNGSLIWRSENLPKKAEKGSDNMLKVMSDARKAALDMRILNPSYGDYEGSKVNNAADKIKSRYDQWATDRGTQLVFIDLSTPKGAKAKEKAVLEELVRLADDGDEAAAEKLSAYSEDDIEALNATFSVYDDLKAKLIARGIPEAEIAFIHDANTDLRKEELFARMRTGRVRVLMGSTSKMGAGTNVQNRLVALHHLDAPWRPSDLEQREGRIIRQGNELFERDPDGFEVEIFRYATKETLDSRMWQTIEGKARFIEQVRKGSVTQREMEDVAGEAMNAAEMKAAASGNPMILEEMTLRQQLRKLDNEKRAFQREQYRIRDLISDAERNVVFWDKRAAEIEADKDRTVPGTKDFSLTVGGIIYDKRINAGIAIMEQAGRIAESGKAEGDHEIGAFGDFKLKLHFPRNEAKSFTIVLSGKGDYETNDMGLDNDPSGAVLRAANAVSNLDGELAHAIARRDAARRAVPGLKAQVNTAGWAKAAEFDKAEARHREVLDALKPKKKDKPAETAKSDARYSRSHREPVATLTGNELGEWHDMRDLGNKVRDWYRDNLVGEKVINRETGWEIGFNNKGADKVSGRKGDTLMRIVPALREIIEGGRLIESLSDNRNRADIKAIHKIGATVVLAGQPRDVIVTIRQTNDGKFHYDLSRDNGDGSRFSTARMEGGGARLLPTEAGGNPTVRIPNGQVRSPAFEGSAADNIVSDTAGDINIDFAPPDTLASGADGFSAAADAQAHLRESAYSLAIGKMLDAGRIVIHDDATTLPGKGHPDGAIQGLTTTDGTIHLVASNLTRASIEPVLLHEAFHSGVRPLIGDAAWNRVMERVSTATHKAMERAATGMAGPHDAFWTAALTNARVAGTPEAHLAEEVAAYAIEHSEQAPDGVRDMIDRLIGAVKAWLLRRFGIQAGAVTPRELRALAIAALRDWDASTAAPQITQDGTRYSMASATPPEADKGSLFDKAKATMSRAITAAMVGAKGSDKDRGRFSTLALVPTRPLFLELAQGMPSARTYIDLKMSMDTMRNDWHALAAEVVQRWTRFASKNKAANKDLMAIMHESTLAQVDPTTLFDSFMTPGDWYGLRNNDPDSARYEDLLKKQAEDKERKAIHDALVERFGKLPVEAQALFREVRDHYRRMADATQKQVLDNVEEALKAIDKKAERTYDDELKRIADEGLTGKERDAAIDDAERRRTFTKSRTKRNKAARLRKLRNDFESNRLRGAYFPLARFGNYFVTLRDANGKVVSFSRFESLKKRDAFVADIERTEPDLKIEKGVLDAKPGDTGAVDAKFMADLDAILDGAGAPEALRDAFWQRYLETLPDMSIRKNRIHRKGTAGFDTDAIRAFAHNVFHGSHQLARLTYAIRMQTAVDEMAKQAQEAPNPDRAMAVSNEIRWRHNFIMNPSQAPLSHLLTSLSFIWTMGANLSSAFVNIDQTFTKGIPWIAADRELRPGVARTTTEIMRAMRDFTAGHGWAEKSSKLTADEKAAMRAGYENGLIDRTQAHDVAGVAETGVAYSARRDSFMKFLSWPMHQTERFNREVTFLASYRMAREKGMEHGAAIRKASDLTWMVHFDNQSTSKPRFMQGDIGRVAFAMKSFQANILYRIFRDLHQAVKGESKEVQKEAIGRLAGTFVATALSAGVKGSIGYSTIMMIMAIAQAFAGGDDDDPEQVLRKWVLEHTGDTMVGRAVGGMMMDGIPGYLTGTALSGRIGMSDLWFRSSDRDLEGADAFVNLAGQVLGVPFGLGYSAYRGGENMLKGNVWRGAESMSPAAVRNIMKAVRYGWEGALNQRGAAVVENVPVADIIKQAIGFTPAQIAEQNALNAASYNMQERIRDRKAAIMDELWRFRDDPKRRAGAIDKVKAFNADHPEAAITGKGINQSMRGRQRYLTNAVGGANIDKRLRPKIEEKLPPSIY